MSGQLIEASYVVMEIVAGLGKEQLVSSVAQSLADSAGHGPGPGPPFSGRPKPLDKPKYLFIIITIIIIIINAYRLVALRLLIGSDALGKMTTLQSMRWLSHVLWAEVVVRACLFSCFHSSIVALKWC